MPEPEVTPTPDQNDPAQPSPEEQAQAELEKARQQTEAEEKGRIEAERKLAELEAQKREMAFVDEVRDTARAAGLAFYESTANVVKLLKSEPGVDVDVYSGVIHHNGRKISLEDALRLFAGRHANLIERSAAELRHERETARGPKSKAELTTWKEKSDYIDKFGLSAYEQLPLTPPTSKRVEDMDPAEFARLPIRERIKARDKHGADGLARILEKNRRTK